MSQIDIRERGKEVRFVNTSWQMFWHNECLSNDLQSRENFECIRYSARDLKKLLVKCKGILWGWNVYSSRAKVLPKFRIKNT